MSWNIAKPGDQINGPVAVTGNLNVDANTLFVDSANNRVGVLTASPTVPLDVVGDAKVSGNLIVDTNTLVVDSSNKRLGIGTATPSESLDVNGAIYVRGANALKLDNASNNYVAQIKNTGASGQSSLEFLLGSPYGTKMALDNSGNLGLGVTPSAWETANSVRALQFNAGSLISYSSNYIWLGQNFFRNSGGTDIYSTTAPASRYQQFNGTHIWWNAASGTAGTAISFTQAMTLEATGNLLINRTSTIGTNSKLNVQLHGTTASSYSAPSNAAISIDAGTSTNSVIALVGGGDHGIYRSNSSGAYDVGISLGSNAERRILFTTAGTDKMALDASGNLGVGVSPSARLHTYISDAGTNNLVEIARLQRATTGTAAVGFGQYLRFDLERGDGANEVAGFVGTKWSNATAGVSKGDLIFGGSNNGAVAATMTLDANGKLLFSTNGTASAPTIANANNPDTGLYWPTTSDTLALAVGGSDAVYIDSGRRVIIGGNTVPDNGLSLYVVKSGVGLGHYISATVGYVGTWTNNDFGLASNGTERLRIKSTGQVNFVGLASDPAGAAPGDVYYNTTTNKLKCYNGTTWNDLF